MGFEKHTVGPHTLYRGDCLEILPTIEAGSVDAVVTDPPYGIKVCNRSDGGVGSISSGSKFYGRESWDSKPCDKKVIDWILGLSVKTVIWGGNYFNLPPTPCLLVWDKMQRGFSFADAEIAWTNSKKAIRIFSYSRGELTSEGKVHPTQKPVELMIWGMDVIGIGRDFKTVLDPFMGSGTTGVACIQTGRKFIGIEIDAKYFDIACKRMEEAYGKGSLFEEVSDEQPTLFAMEGTD